MMLGNEGCKVLKDARDAYDQAYYAGAAEVYNYLQDHHIGLTHVSTSRDAHNTWMDEGCIEDLVVKYPNIYAIPPLCIATMQGRFDMFRRLEALAPTMPISFEVMYDKCYADREDPCGPIEWEGVLYENVPLNLNDASEQSTG